MSWRKNGFSIGLWAVYSAAVCGGLALCGFRAGEALGLGTYGAAGAAAGLCLLACAVFFCLRLLTAGNAGERGSGKACHNGKAASGDGAAGGGSEEACAGDRGEGKVSPALRSGRGMTVSLLAVGLLALGLILRASWVQYAGEEAAYYDTARIVEGGLIPQVVHGAVYFYLQLLHGFFLFVGNKWMAGIWLQTALQLAGCTLLFLAVRKLAGELPALVLLAFEMLSPERILQGLTYSPRMLYLCVYALGLLCVALFLQKSAEGKIRSVYDILLIFLAGAAPALALYMDISGATLLAVAAGVLWLKKPAPGNRWGSGPLQLGALLLGSAGFFCAYMGLDAFASGKRFFGVFEAWRSLYLSGGYELSLWGKGTVSVTYLVLFFLLAVGIFGFWNRRGAEKAGVWIAPCLLLAGLEFLHLTSQDLQVSGLLFSFLAVLAGIGLEGCFLRRRGAVCAAQEQEAPETGLVMVEEGKAHKVKMIENPLPLPKKHVKKVMDYGFEPEEGQMKFDVPVRDDDDFDLL